MTDPFEEELAALLDRRSRDATSTTDIDTIVAAARSRRTRRPLLAVAALAALVGGAGWFAAASRDSTTTQITSGASGVDVPSIPSSTEPTEPPAAPSTAPPDGAQRCTTDQPAGTVAGTARFTSDETVRTYVDRSAPVDAPAKLQIQYDDGRRSEIIDVETSVTNTVVELRDGRLLIAVANKGNTAQSGGLVLADGCNLTRVTRDDGTPFTYVFFATGRGCAPACHRSVCLRPAAVPFEVVLTSADLAERGAGEPPRLSDEPPRLSDDLLYDWTVERFELRGDAMTRVDRQQGVARYGDLQVPRAQGFTC